MLKALTAAALASAVLATPGRADTLQFNLQGLNPDGTSTYRGTVSLTEVAIGPNGEKSGIVTWVVERAAPVRGIAVAGRDRPGRLSISFPKSPVPGVALGQFGDDGSVRVLWYIGGETAGSELWTRRR